VADVFVINKADHPKTGELERDLNFMMDLTSWPDGWRPPIVRAIALSGTGTADVLDAISRHQRHLSSSGELDRRRGRRALAELRRVLIARLEQRADATLGQAGNAELRAAVVERRIDPWSAADQILGLLD